MTEFDTSPMLEGEIFTAKGDATHVSRHRRGHKVIVDNFVAATQEGAETDQILAYKIRYGSGSTTGKHVTSVDMVVKADRKRLEKDVKAGETDGMPPPGSF